MYKNFALLVTSVWCLIVSQYFPILSGIVLLVWVPYTIFLYSRRDPYPALVTLLVSGFLNDGLLNLATVRFSGFSLLYIYICALFLISIFLRRRWLSDKFLLGGVLYILITILFSFLEYPTNSFFFRDLIIYLLVPIFFVVFRCVDFWQFLRLLLAVGCARLLASDFYYMTGFSLREMESHIRDFVVSNDDELSILYLATALSLFFVKSRLYTYSVAYLVLFVLSIFFFGINAAGIGSQSILVIFLVLSVGIGYGCLHLNYYSLSIFWIGCVFALVVVAVGISSGITVPEYLSFKFDNILISVSSIGQLDSVPYSVQVRVVELLNIIDRPLLQNLFGGGFGSSFSDHSFPFLSLGVDAFSPAEIEERIFYSPHNVNYWLLKTGMLAAVFFCILFFSLYRNLSNECNFVVLSSLVVVLFFNFGYGYKYSLVLGLAMVFASGLRRSSRLGLGESF